MLGVMSISSIEAGAYSPLHERMKAIAGTRTFRHLSELTGTHPETVRRYMSGQPPSSEYLAALCHALNINGDWMLTGRGPMKVGEIESHALRSASAPDLLSALASAVERLIDRVEVLERYLQSMEAHWRSLPAASTPTGPQLGTLSLRHAGASPAQGIGEALPGVGWRHESSEARPAHQDGESRESRESPGPAGAAARVERVLDVLPKRPPETDRGAASSGRR
jgi:transcriptional regulator with XRE-family HTH domain